MCCEVDHAQRLGARQLGKLQRQALGVGERALGPDQQVGEIDAVVDGVGPFAPVAEDVEVVAGEPAQHLGPARLDFGAMLLCQLLDEAGDLGAAPA